MRTTIEIKDELMAILQEKCIEQHMTMKDEVNFFLSKGLGMDELCRSVFRVKTYSMGKEPVNYSKAWALVDELVFDAVSNKMDLHK